MNHIFTNCWWMNTRKTLLSNMNSSTFSFFIWVLIMLWLLAWCSKQLSAPSWFFWMVYDKLPKHSLVSIVQKIESTPSFSAKQQYESTRAILPELLDWYVNQDSELTWDLHIEVHSEGNHYDSYSYSIDFDILANWFLSKKKKLNIHWNILIILKDNSLYTYIESLEYTPVGNELQSVHLRWLLLKRYKETRIRRDIPTQIGYFVPTRRKDRINSNMISSHMVSNMSNGWYAATTGETLWLEDTITELTEHIDITLVPEKLAISLIHDSEENKQKKKSYITDIHTTGDIHISSTWTTQFSSSRSGYTSSFDWNILIPSGIKSTLSFDSTYTPVRVSKHIPLPVSFIEWSTILVDQISN